MFLISLVTVEKPLAQGVLEIPFRWKTYKIFPYLLPTLKSWTAAQWSCLLPAAFLCLFLALRFIPHSLPGLQTCFTAHFLVGCCSGSVVRRHWACQPVGQRFETRVSSCPTPQLLPNGLEACKCKQIYRYHSSGRVKVQWQAPVTSWPVS